MSVRHTVPAVIAADARLDEARAVAFVAAAKEGQEDMTRMHVHASRRVVSERRTRNGPCTQLSRNRRANHRAELLIIH